MWMGYPTPCTIAWPIAVKRRDRASCQVLSCLIVAVDSGAFPGDVKPLGLDIQFSVDDMGTCATESYME
jgi:hypothetical protein